MDVSLARWNLYIIDILSIPVQVSKMRPYFVGEMNFDTDPKMENISRSFTGHRYYQTKGEKVAPPPR